MKTVTRNQLHDSTKPEPAAPEGAADSFATDVGVSHVRAGIAEVLNMRVGCWRAPVHLGTEPTAA